MGKFDDNNSKSPFVLFYDDNDKEEERIKQKLDPLFDKRSSSDFKVNFLKRCAGVCL